MNDRMLPYMVALVFAMTALIVILEKKIFVNGDFLVQIFKEV